MRRHGRRDAEAEDHILVYVTSFSLPLIIHGFCVTHSYYDRILLAKVFDIIDNTSKVHYITSPSHNYSNIFIILLYILLIVSQYSFLK